MAEAKGTVRVSPEEVERQRALCRQLWERWL